ncbi:SufE family protein [Polycladidibacter hongkongensis]|uniref:SufE family protein n=1 Tax=Polycladidibacter hongkongensis TaxID=1647556 RepID=UPI000831502D|nr:SufE family protein [Pseudovibrio hongkongensis]
MASSINDILEGFEYLEEWEDRYKYLIELGRELDSLKEGERCDANKVQGCVSQVWLAKEESRSEDGEPILLYRGDSDAMIVRGLVAIVLAQFSGNSAAHIAASDIDAVFRQIGLKEHLTPQRSNGLAAMVQRIKQDAATALAAG